VKRAAITGAGGFIGRNLTRRLVRAGVEVFALDLPAAREACLEGGAAAFYPLDLSDSVGLAELLKELRADVCYHLAWAGVSTDVKNDVVMQMSNLPFLINVLSACEKAGCGHVVIPGSSSEFAYCGQTVTGENLPAPGDAYAASKAAAQVLARWYAMQRGLSLNWLLIGSIYGPGRNDSNVLTYTIKALLEGKETAYSRLEQMWDYIYIDDLADALYLVGERGKPGAVYPVGSGQARPLAWYIEQVRALIAPEAALGIGKLPYKNGHRPDNSALDISKLRADTGFAPQVSFEAGIRQTIQYFRDLEQAK